MPKKLKRPDALGWWAHPFCYRPCKSKYCGESVFLPSIWEARIKLPVFVDAREGWAMVEQLWAQEKELA